MSTKHVTLAEADGHFAELIEAARHSEEVLIETEGKTSVMLVVVKPPGQ